MLLNDYLSKYLGFYKEMNLLGMGTIYRLDTFVEKKNDRLLPATFHYRLDDLKSQDIDHFILFLVQFEKRSYETLKKEIQSDFHYCNEILNEEGTIFFKNIGSIIIFNNQITLFEEEDPNKTFGNPTIKLERIS